ncbi:hypothetical protein ACK8HX_17375 [Oryzobacter sp. R7]|uniref:hypothetical protein n=1 Tax=Oryzobacter faecalis TaxID=3388656 RepID=UPI00398C8A77
MVDRVQHVPVAGPRVVDAARPRPAHGILRTARTATALVLLAATVVVVGGSFGDGVGATLVRVSFVGLWLSLPWLLTVGATHLTRRAGLPARLVAAAAAVSWAAAVGTVVALTPGMLGSSASAGWGLAGAAAAAAVLVVGARLGAPPPPPGDEARDWLRGPFLD